jgi:replication protein O
MSSQQRGSTIDPVSLLIPNSTQVPNFLIDRLMPVMQSADWKLICLICRKTFGWQKKRDRISLTQFVKLTGLSMPWVIKRLNVLTACGLLQKTTTTRGSVWALNLDCDLAKVLNSVQYSQFTKVRRESTELSGETKHTNTKQNKNLLRSTSLSEEEERATRAVYDTYPRHIGLNEALREIKKAAISLVSSKHPGISDLLDALAFLKERVALFATSPAGQRGHMTPHPAAWFRKGRYFDDPKEWNHLDDFELQELERRREATVGAH